MAKKIYTTVSRLVGDKFYYGTPALPVEVTFPKGFDPLSRKVQTKGKAKTKQMIKGRDRSGREVEIEAEVETDVVVEKVVPFTAIELAAVGLIVVDEKEPPPGEKLAPHFAAGAGQPAAVPPAHQVQGRASDQEPK